MLKFAAMLSAFFCCTFLGTAWGKRFEARKRMLIILRDDISLFRLYLQHDGQPLQILLQRCSGPDNELFRIAGEKIAGGQVPECALKNAFQELRDRGDRLICCLQDEEQNRLMHYFSTLGRLEPKAQCSQTDLLLGELDLILRVAEEQGRTQGRLYRSLGWMAGAACAILLI